MTCGIIVHLPFCTRPVCLPVLARLVLPGAGARDWLVRQYPQLELLEHQRTLSTRRYDPSRVSNDMDADLMSLSRNAT